MREDAIDDQGIDGDNAHRHEDGNHQSKRNWYPFFDGVGVLYCVVPQREMLVEGGDDFIDCCVEDGENAGVGIDCQQRSRREGEGETRG